MAIDVAQDDVEHAAFLGAPARGRAAGAQGGDEGVEGLLGLRERGGDVLGRTVRVTTIGEYGSRVQSEGSPQVVQQGSASLELVDDLPRRDMCLKGCQRLAEAVEGGGVADGPICPRTRVAALPPSRVHDGGRRPALAGEPPRAPRTRPAGWVACRLAQAQSSAHLG